ncbi:chloride channel CLIC-like protein 1 isoform X1 [Octopus sinensis]|uniref:Chloride channel CLIC-like protein 1 n=2 Tax=Octopus sinensis TaxID=2607531 RepID=A0A7E6F6K9_9MOLL|nr:chloride channel CLIC-like protein 1 isoform X1 [Octopus sinensis]XP_036362582.1 chloride channel CLIC-like protein 1 isoform X1 [Octopus sinensis]
MIVLSIKSIMKPSKMYLTLVQILTLTCILNQHTVHSDLWERFPNIEQTCSQDLVVKQFVRKLLSKLPDVKQSTANQEESQKKTDYELFFELSITDHKILHEFVNGQTNFDDVVEVLSHMVKDITPFNSNYSGSTYFREYFVDSVEMCFLVAVCVIIATTFLFNLFTAKRISKLIVVTFFINIMWNWFYLYEEEKAKTYHALQQGPPKGCVRDDKSFKTLLVEWFSVQKDECLTYLVYVDISPFFRVRPYEALSISMTNIIFKPFQYIGQHISTFIRDICAPLPLYMQPIIILLMFFSMLVSLMILSGYSFSTFFFSISKKNNNDNNKDVLNKLLQKLEYLEDNQPTKDQIEDVASLLKKYIKTSEDLKSLEDKSNDSAIMASGDADLMAT